MGSSPRVYRITTHAQEPVDPHFPRVKLPKATPRSKAPASGTTFSTLPLTVWDLGPSPHVREQGARHRMSWLMITVGTNIMGGFPYSKGSPAWLSGAKGYPSTPPRYMVEVLMEFSEGRAAPV